MKKIVILLGIIGALSFNSCSDDYNHTHTDTCDSISKVIANEEFNVISTSNYNITDIRLNNNCLEVTIRSSGCDPQLWEMNLYCTKTHDNVSHLRRELKIELINNQECLAVFQKSISFDLTPLQVDERNSITLNIEGWDKHIVYKY